MIHTKQKICANFVLSFTSFPSLCFFFCFSCLYSFFATINIVVAISCHYGVWCSMLLSATLFIVLQFHFGFFVRNVVDIRSLFNIFNVAECTNVCALKMSDLKKFFRVEKRHTVGGIRKENDALKVIFVIISFLNFGPNQLNLRSKKKQSNYY